MRLNAPAAGIIAVVLLFAAATPVEVTGTNATEDPPVDYVCEFILTGGKEPILTEREVLHLRHCYTNATVVHIDPDAQFDFVEMNDQVWTVESGGSSVRRILAKSRKSTISLRSRCKKGKCTCTGCEDEDPNTRRQRKLPGSELQMQSNFEAGMLSCLTDSSLYPEEGDYDAFDGLETLSGWCAMSTDHNPPVADVISDDNLSGNISATEESKCLTILFNAPTPLLTEPEMAHFDKCWINSWNEYHSNDPLDDVAMVGSEIVEQNPAGNFIQEGSLTQRKLASSTKVFSRTKKCRKCKKKKDEPKGDRRRALQGGWEEKRRLFLGALSFEDLFAFDASLCDCLKFGPNNNTYAAFPSDLWCKTECSAPIVTIAEFLFTQKAQTEAFETAEERREAVFDAKKEDTKVELLTTEEDLKEESKIFHKEKHEEQEELIFAATQEVKLAELAVEKAKLEARSAAFNLNQTKERVRFMSYQTLESEVFHEKADRECVSIKTKDNCDDVFVQHPITVVRNGTDNIEARITQNFNMDLAGECLDTALTAAGSTELSFFVQYDDELASKKRQSTCSDMTLECGETYDLTLSCRDDLRTTVYVMVRNAYLPTTYERTNIRQGTRYGDAKNNLYIQGEKASYWGSDWRGTDRGNRGSGKKNRGYWNRNIRHRVLQRGGGKRRCGNVGQGFCFMEFEIDCTCLSSALDWH